MDTKKILFPILLIYSSVSIFATDQYPDLVIYNQDTFYISATFDEEFPLHAILNNDLYKDKFKLKENCESNACYRGYRAVWQIENDKLYLKTLKYCCSDHQYDLTKLFEKAALTEQGVKAFWTNGTLNLYSKPINVFTLGEAIDSIELNLKNGKVLAIKKEK